VSDTEFDSDLVQRYTPPYIKYGGFHFGARNSVQTTYSSKPIVHHSVYAAEIVTQRHATGEDWNGSLAGTLANLLLDRHDGGYQGFNRGDYSIRAFCWCESPDCDWCEMGKEYFHDHLTGLCLWWYKHPNRDLEANRAYTAAEIEALAGRYGVNLHHPDA
jgi:hypothetical protein